LNKILAIVCVLGAPSCSGTTSEVRGRENEKGMETNEAEESGEQDAN
jgi:hypothetical protein